MQPKRKRTVGMIQVKGSRKSTVRKTNSNLSEIKDDKATYIADNIPEPASVDPVPEQEPVQIPLEVQRPVEVTISTAALPLAKKSSSRQAPETPLSVPSSQATLSHMGSFESYQYSIADVEQSAYTHQGLPKKKKILVMAIAGGLILVIWIVAISVGYTYGIVDHKH